MSGFDADWLAQREPFDLAARDQSLEMGFVRALTEASSGGSAATSTAPSTAPPNANAPIRLADLAGGTAANFRALAPRLAVDQDWVLVDQDAALLAAAPGRVMQWAQARGWQARAVDEGCEVHAGAARWTLRTRQVDLAEALASIDATQFDGIVTTAFLDLVSADWLTRFARWLRDARRPLLATLTVDGPRTWQPGAPDDDLIARAFRRHQAGDKGFGPSVGADAAGALAGTLRDLGCTVTLARSDWRIGPTHSGMLQRLCDEAARVALDVDPQARPRIDAWRAARSAAIVAGQASLMVGHLDLLARP